MRTKLIKKTYTLLFSLRIIILMFHLWVLISYLKTYSKLLANKFNLRYF